ncbi:hypothetical protein QW180_04915 [Vibrio sinaloensis]|nr:hypothetical protein [Vibrio sinaloensis]
MVTACRNTDTHYQVMADPMRWSEDFGQFTVVAKQGAMFALGAGELSPQLHNPDYDFDDSLIPVGKALFLDLIKQINELT